MNRPPFRSSNTIPPDAEPGAAAEAPSAETVLRHRVKAELRKRMRALRQTAPESACAARSALLVKALEAHPALSRARSVALFWPMTARHEVDLRAFDVTLRARGVRVAYPRVEESGAMSFRFAAVDALVPSDFGGDAPPESAPEALPGELEAIVVPALAVDPAGHRIGYGAGFYDRALPRFAPPAETFAVAFDYQLIAEVPAVGFDVPVGWLVTDKRVLAAGE